MKKFEEGKKSVAVKTLETETAKVVFFENLKKMHGGKIFIGDVLGAWNLATCKLGKLEKNVAKTTNAGYAILENSVGDWVSVLNNRFEINLATGQTFNIWTDSAAIENAKNYAWDEVEEGISYAKNADEKTFWFNVCQAKFVDSLIKFGVEDLIAAEIIREKEIIACIDDYVVDVDAATEVEEVNAENSVEVKTEKPNNQEVETAEVEEMSENEKECLNFLEKQVDLTVEGLEEAASGDYENLADYLDDNLGVEIRIDGRNLKYSSALITLAIGGPGVWFDTASERVFGRWGLGVECEKSVNRQTCIAVDEYYRDYYEIHR